MSSPEDTSAALGGMQPDAGTVLSSLPAMFEEIRNSPKITQPSEFWEELNAKNVEMLQDDGFDEIKRTVNGNYFQFVPPQTKGSEQWEAVSRDFARHPKPPALRGRLTEPYRVPGAWGGLRARAKARRYAFYVAAMWEYVNRRDSRGILRRLEEPALGHPITVKHRGREVSEDLNNSVLELTAMLDGMGVPEMPEGSRMIELGAGYGRLTWAFQAAFPGMRSIIVDIPPALAISERYLTELFPERRVFRFRHFDSADEIADELDSSQIAFLTPNQLELLPPLEVDLFATISSLHEMKFDQIAHYIGSAGRHAAGGHFFTKQWKYWYNPNDDIKIYQHSYPIPDDWQVVFEREHPVQTLFFEALYRLPSSSTTTS